MGVPGEKRQRQFAALVLAVECYRIFHIHAHDVGAGLQRLGETVGPQSGDEK
jgi:hypothetical protein